MKKSTLRRYAAQTNNEATASNLNKVMGKRDARQVLNMDAEAETAYLEKWIRAAKKEFKTQFESRSMGREINAKAVREILAALTIDDIETAKGVTGSVDVRKLVSKAVAKADRNAAKAADKAQRDAERETAKAAKAQQRSIDKGAEVALASMLVGEAA